MKISPSVRIFGISCALAGVVALAGCGKTEEKAAPPVVVVAPPAAPAPAAAPAAAPAPAPAAVAPKPEPKPAAAPPAPARREVVQDKQPWQLLGQDRAEFKNVRGHIQVGKAKGEFREIQIRVEDATLDLNSVIVVLVNGESLKLAFQHQFRENSRTRAIDLPGGKRSIQRVEYTYGNANRRNGTATVQLYGR